MGSQSSTLGTGKYPYSIGGTIQLSVYFNGIEFPFTPRSLLGFIHMSESSKLDLPMVRVNLTDGIDFLATSPSCLVEGSQLTLVVTARGVDTFSRTFRINSTHIAQEKVGDVINLDGYLDYPKYWIETTNNHYVGQTSSQVLRALATYAGFTYQGIDTNDAQGWHGGLKRIHAFCHEIAKHGYVNDSSCMKRAVTLDGRFLYQDVSTLDVATPKAVFTIGSVEDGKIPVVSHLPRNLGGATNRRSGYKQAMLEYSMVRENLYRTHTNMSLNMDEGGEMNLNPSVRTLINQGVQMVGPIDYGNVNDNYHRALYQNKRGTGLFNVGLDIVTPVPTVTNPGISIFDTVAIETPQEIQEQAGSYIVVSHAIQIDPSQYHEKFELTRRSAAVNVSSNVNAGNYDDASTSLYTDS